MYFGITIKFIYMKLFLNGQDISLFLFNSILNDFSCAELLFPFDNLTTLFRQCHRIIEMGVLFQQNIKEIMYGMYV